MAITLNATVVGKAINKTQWTIVAQSADSSGNEELKAAVAGKSHYIKKIRVDMCPGTTAASFTINADTTAILGPIDLIDYSSYFEYEFLNAIKVTAGAAINLDTEAADQVHVILEGATDV